MNPNTPKTVCSKNTLHKKQQNASTTHRGFVLLLVLLFSLVASAQSSQPSTENKEHNIRWKTSPDFSFVTPPKGTLLLARHQDEHGGTYPTISITTDTLPTSITTAKDYAEQNLALLPQFGITLLEKRERVFSNLPAVEASLRTSDESLFLHQVYLVRGKQGYVITTTCPAPLFKRLQKTLSAAREAITFQGTP
jgi:hypothetical protein